MADLKIDIRTDLHDADDEIRDVDNALEDLEDQAERSAKRMKTIGDSMVGVGKKFTLFLTAPILAAGGAAVKMAMDAVESRNLFEVSMGKMTAAAEKWSVHLSEKLGVNRYESQKTIGTFNVMLKSMGQNEDAAFDMAQGLSQLGYDLASFFNLEPEDAFLKLQSAISGEVEPLKRLGIIVNDTTIKQWALNNGMIKQGQQLTENQKIVARYNVIMERTRDAQGDLARTLDSPANKLRLLKSRMTETAVELGTKLLPLFEDLLGIIEKGVKWFSDLSDANQKQILTLAGIAAAVGPVLLSFGKLIKLAPKMRAAFAMMTGPLGIIVTAAAAAGAAIDTLIDKSIEKSDQEMDAMVQASASHADYWAFRSKLIDEEIVTVEQFKEIYEKHGRNYKRVMVAIANLPEYEYLREAWKNMGKTVEEESQEIVEDIDYMAITAKMKLLELKLEMEKWKIPKLVKSPEELLQNIGFTDFDETFQAEWDASMSGAEERSNEWLNKQLESFGIYGAQKKDMFAKAEKQEASFYDVAGVLGSQFAGRSKEISLAMAIINTAQGVTKALSAYPPPMSFIMAAAQAAAGAVQVGTISSQSIPSAAEGGVLPRDMLIQAHKEELISPVPLMKETFREVIREPLATAPAINHFHIYIGADKLDDRIISVFKDQAENGNITFPSKVIGQ